MMKSSARPAVRDGRLRELQDVKCAGCGRKLFRVDPDALAPGKILEIKCRCDMMNYRVGQVEASATS